MVQLLDTKEAFDAAIKRSKKKLTVVDFTASWCGPCQQIAPIYERMAKEMPDASFFKVDVDENEEAAEECLITAMPTFKLFFGGNCIGEVQGADMKELYSLVMDGLQLAELTGEDKKSDGKAKATQLGKEAKATAKRVKQIAQKEEGQEEQRGEDGGQDEDLELVKTEKRLIALCKERKAAHKAEPKDADLARAYAEAKAEYQAFRDAKAAAGVTKSSRKKQTGVTIGVDAAKDGDEAVETWTCPTCNVTLAVRADGHAKTQHLEGKAHLKRVKRMEKEQAKEAAAGNEADVSAPAGSESAGLFACQLCACTVAASAKLTHESGSKHAAKLKQVSKLIDSRTMQKGDWLCVKHGPSVQHNFASKSKCMMRNCEGTREQGLSYEQAAKLASKAWRAAQGGAGSKGGEEDAAEATEEGDGDGEKTPKRAEGGKVKELNTPGKAGGSSGPAAPVVTAGDLDLEMRCKDCKAEFSFAVSEQAFYAERGYAAPTRCLECRSKKRKRQAGEV